MKEEYLAIKVVLKNLDYNAHQWIICVDLKMLDFFLGQIMTHVSWACEIVEQETSTRIKITSQNISHFK